MLSYLNLSENKKRTLDTMRGFSVVVFVDELTVHYSPTLLIIIQNNRNNHFCIKVLVRLTDGEVGEIEWVKVSKLCRVCSRGS